MIGEGAAIDVAHGEVMGAFVFAEFVDGNDVRVLELGRGGGFGVETMDEIPARGGSAGEELEGDDAVDAELAGFEDDAAAAAAEFFEEFVIGEKAAFGEGFDRGGSGEEGVGGAQPEAMCAESFR